MKIADAKNRVPVVAQEATRARRTYAPQFKRGVVAQCLVPGVSVSAIALSHGINANVIRKWLPRREPGTSTALASMLPVTIEPREPVVTRKAPMQATLGAARPDIELSLAGATVRLPAGFDPAELRSIVQILTTLR
ncbi:MAG: transposase [Burkholderiaceae bacterium]|nr:transposase [Burkholderiaceae bacterium]